MTTTPDLQVFDTNDLERLAQHGELVVLEAGETLIEQGCRPNLSYVVVTGTASVTVCGDEVAVLGTGTVVGEVGLLDHGPTTATVVAATPMELLVFDPPTFRRVMHEPGIALAVLTGLAARLRRADEALCAS
jgi:CRP/FNR family transcriptional regulator, cyclic AMP receptor protein